MTKLISEFQESLRAALAAKLKTSLDMIGFVDFRKIEADGEKTFWRFYVEIDRDTPEGDETITCTAPVEFLVGEGGTIYYRSQNDDKENFYGVFDPGNGLVTYKSRMLSDIETSLEEDFKSELEKLRDKKELGLPDDEEG